MAKKKKNSNYITEKTVAKKQQALKARKNAKIKKYTLIVTAIVLITACVIAGLVLIAMGINKHYEKKAYEDYQHQKEHLYDDVKDTVDKQKEKLEVTHKVTLTLKGYGDVTIDLYGKEAPATVANFVKLVKNGHYDGTTFGGGLKGAYLLANGNTGTTLGDIPSEKTGNDITHIRGTISMLTSTGDKCSANKFFIVAGKQTSYDKEKYTPFGMVTSGMDVIDKAIADVSFAWNAEYGDSAPEVKIEKATLTETLQEVEAPKVTHTAQIEIDGYGVIDLELYGYLAPYAVDQFVKLVNEGYYNGKTFTQAVKDGMFVGGGKADSTLNTIKGDFYANGVMNTLKHERGVISMFRATLASGYNTASHKFFIVQQTNATNSITMDGYYAAFGKVLGDGMDIIDKIYKDLSDGKALSSNGTISDPQKQPVIKSATITGVLDDRYKVETTHKAEIEIEGYGTLKLDLYGNNAPETVEHFIKLVNEGFYDGKTFHRAVESFMIQGGCPNKNGTGSYKDSTGKEVNIKGEFFENGFYNAVRHERGVISMARGDKPNSASCQFFIVHKTNTSNTMSLDYKYAAFGKLDEDSMKIVDQIFADLKEAGSIEKESIKTDKQPVIKSIRITEIVTNP